MSEDLKLGRRLTDFSGGSDFVNLMMELQKQSLMLANLTEKVQHFPELSSKVDLLVSQMETMAHEVKTIEQLQELVGWHDKLLKLLASVASILFPMIITGVFWLGFQIMELKNKQNIQEFKLQYMEKINGSTTPPVNSSARIDGLTWDLWYFDSPRFQEVPFYRTTMEEQFTECELHSGRDLSLYVQL